MSSALGMIEDTVVKTPYSQVLWRMEVQMREAADLTDKLMAVAAEKGCFKACFPLPSCHLTWLVRVKGELAGCSLCEPGPRSAPGQRTGKGRTSSGRGGTTATGRQGTPLPHFACPGLGSFPSRAGRVPARRERAAAPGQSRAGQGQGQVQGGRTAASGHVVPG